MCEQEDNSQDYPFEIENALLTKSFLFKIDSAPNNVNKIWHNYTILKMTNDEEIIIDFLQIVDKTR